MTTETPGKLLTPDQRHDLQQSLAKTLRPEYRRRIEIMLLADAGHSRQQICKALQASHETVRYWMTIAQTGMALHWQEQPMGRPKRIPDQYRDRLRELVNHSPRDYGYSFRQWTAHWLSKHLAQEWGIQVSDRYINYLLKGMGLSTRKKASDNT